MLNFFLSLTLSTIALSNPLDSLENCKTQQILHGKWAINRFFTMADGCLVQVTPIDKPNQIYREYIFDQMGRFAIFNSIQGSYETATSMKSYFLFPVVQTPSIEKISDKIVEVTLATGEKAQFDSQDLFLFSLNGKGIQYKEEKKVSLVEGGAFEILAHDEIYIDAGWKIGDRSYRDSSKSSRLYLNGKSCWISNSTLFVYSDSFTGQELYQPALRWNLSQLKGWFSENCQ
jgi:hypothetical protein